QYARQSGLPDRVAGRPPGATGGTGFTHRRYTPHVSAHPRQHADRPKGRHQDDLQASGTRTDHNHLRSLRPPAPWNGRGGGRLHGRVHGVNLSTSRMAAVWPQNRARSELPKEQRPPEIGFRRAFSPGGQRGTRTPDLYDVSVVQELFPVFALSTKPVVMAILAIHLSVVSTLWPSNSVQLAAVWPQ